MFPQPQPMRIRKNDFLGSDSRNSSQNLHDVFLPRIPTEQFSQVSNSSFARQDSLSVCSRLQENDRLQNPDMMDFMERDMDLDQYIGALRGLDVPPEQIELDDGELQKSHILFEDQTDQYDPFQHHEGLGLVPQNIHMPPDGSANTSVSSDRSACSTPMMFTHNIKSETNDWEYADEPSTSTASSAPRRRRDASADLSTYTPQTKARKYNLKPEEEKQNPSYKLKRARNNDAVRKSRTKQKELQNQRERELKELRDENQRLKAELSVAEDIIQQQKETIASLSHLRR